MTTLPTVIAAPMIIAGNTGTDEMIRVAAEAADEVAPGIAPDAFPLYTIDVEVPVC